MNFFGIKFSPLSMSQEMFELVSILLPPFCFQSGSGGVEQCQLCGKQFTQRCNRIRHERQHMGIFNYRCKLCDRGFNNKDNLHGHMTTVHGEDHSVHCPKCNKQFNYKYSLKSHLKSCNVGNDVNDTTGD